MKPLHLLMLTALMSGPLAARAAAPAACTAAAPTAAAPTAAPAADAANFGLSPLIVHAEGRAGYSLDGMWRTIVDPYENGYYDYRRQPLRDASSYFADRDFHADRTKLVEYDFNTSPMLRVPGDWNTQRPDLYYYEGTVWYRTRFACRPRADRRLFVYFGAANYETVVGLNGHTIGKHTGGFTPFNIEITDRVSEGENTLVVKVDNRRRIDGVPTWNFDWWNYGGLTRSVRIVETPATFVRDCFVQLDPAAPERIAGWVQLDGPEASQRVRVEIPELGASCTVRTDDTGYGSFTLAAQPTRWSPEHPKLYDVRIVAQTDTLCDRIGFRTIETRGRELLLNGRPIFCRGVSIHEEMPYGTSGRAWNAEQARVLLDWAKEMGCNFVRLAHYPHNEAMIRTAEEMGVLVWSEVPVYWTIQWENEATYANAERQLTEMITRDRNRANIIVWSVANETPRSAARLDFLRRLIARARALDPTRLVSAAMEKIEVSPGVMTVRDELTEWVDLISFNEYVGWYGSTPERCDEVTWRFDVEKPVFISEFGGGAVYGRHGDRSERFTEEYLEDLYRRSVAMLERIPGLAGTTPWVLKDFRSPRRQLPDIQDDFNRKGLVSDQGGKKQAFYVMQAWYDRLARKYAAASSSEGE